MSHTTNKNTNNQPYALIHLGGGVLQGGKIGNNLENLIQEALDTYSDGFDGSKHDCYIMAADGKIVFNMDSPDMYKWREHELALLTPKVALEFFHDQKDVYYLHDDFTESLIQDESEILNNPDRFFGYE